MKQLAFLLLFMACIIKVNANDSLIISMLQRIAALQENAGSKFPKGIIPAYRQYDKNVSSIQPDDNIFFNGLVVYTLQKIKHKLPKRGSILVDTITERTARIAHLYKNIKGRETYNFWRTNPPKVFPNSGWINWFDKVNALPDDFDDTAMMLLALQANDSTVKAVHSLMQGYTNNTGKQIKNTLKKYENIPAYSTWFGKKMPIDFDICVMANVLLMAQQYHLAFTKADSASLQLITAVLKAREHVTMPHFIAPHYARTPIILYHVSRLMSVANIPALDSLKPQLINDAYKEWEKTNNFFDKIILLTTLKRLGQPSQKIEQLSVNSFRTFVEENDFVFFIANMASMAPSNVKKYVGNSGIGKFYYYCPAYNYALLIEYMVETKQ